MQVEFTKMHGCGNDYVYIDGSRFLIPAQEKPDFVRKVSDRHFGVGSDGVIFINPSKNADFEMEMWNADGTRAEMCGNGIRCVAKYVYDKRLTDRIHQLVESAGKVKSLTLVVVDGQVKGGGYSSAVRQRTCVRYASDRIGKRVSGDLRLDGKSTRGYFRR